MTFEEQFPSLGVQVHTDDVRWEEMRPFVQKHCLDKQRVKEAIEKGIKNAELEHEKNPEYLIHHACAVTLAHLKKELGLED